ncbi:MAG: hypothetical protein JSS79_08590, partial [Bacteroidetes bacterium]|nr:hypothetical protein [Bacteroidota bacterium]
MTGPNPDVYCASQALTISAPNVYKSYSWEYLIINANSNNGWNPLPTVSGNSFAFKLSDIPGATFKDNIYFRYKVTGCSPTSPVVGPYAFLQDALFVTDVSPQAPICAGGSDGSVQVTLNRALYPNESISAFNFYTANSFTTTSASVTDPQTGVTYVRTTYDFPSIASPVAPVNLDGNNRGTINNVPVGTQYILVTTNEGGCGSPNFSPAITIPVGPRRQLSAAISIASDYHGSALSCNGSSDGKVTVGMNGGGDRHYSFSLNGGPSQSDSVFVGLGAGDYLVTVKDGCATPTTATTSKITITAPQPVVITSLVPSVCNGSNNGIITVNGTGGTGAMSYSLDGTNYQSSNTFTNLAPGSYTITVKDENNCSTTGSVIVSSPLSVGAVSVTHPTCSGTDNGTITLNGSSGGTGVLSWSIGGIFQAETNAFSDVPSGNYTVTVRDANNCTATQSV